MCVCKVCKYSISFMKILPYTVIKVFSLGRIRIQASKTIEPNPETLIRICSMRIIGQCVIIHRKMCFCILLAPADYEYFTNQARVKKIYRKQADFFPFYPSIYISTSSSLPNVYPSTYIPLSLFLPNVSMSTYILISSFHASYLHTVYSYLFFNYQMFSCIRKLLFLFLLTTLCLLVYIDFYLSFST